MERLIKRIVHNISQKTGIKSKTYDDKDEAVVATALDFLNNWKNNPTNILNLPSVETRSDFQED